VHKPYGLSAVDQCVKQNLLLTKPGTTPQNRRNGLDPF